MASIHAGTAPQSTLSFQDFLRETPLLLFPGAMGTELQRRGYATTLPLWSAQANLDAFDLVTRIHADYFAAGAHVAVTNTFRTTPRTFAKVGRGAAEAHDAMKRAVAAANAAREQTAHIRASLQNTTFGKTACKTVGHEGIGGENTSSESRPVPAFIAGSFAPLEDCYEPDLVPSDDALAHEHGQLAEWLAAEQVDFLLPETINALREAKFMAAAAAATGLPYIISFVADADGCLLDGTPLKEAIAATSGPLCLGVAINCRPIDTIDQTFPTLITSMGDNVAGIYPNGIGHPDDDLGWRFEDNADSIAKFVTASKNWHRKGAKILGGCCGTTPAYIKALADAMSMTDRE